MFTCFLRFCFAHVQDTTLEAHNCPVNFPFVLTSKSEPKRKMVSVPFACPSTTMQTPPGESTKIFALLLRNDLIKLDKKPQKDQQLLQAS